MLKGRVNNTNIALNYMMHSEDSSSDRDFYNDKLLRKSAAAQINSGVDAEVYEYKLSRLTEINLNVFFLRYFQNTDLAQIAPYMESAFVDHVRKTNVGLGLLDDNGGLLETVFNNPFEVRQDNHMVEPTILSEQSLSGTEAIMARPMQPMDFIGESMLVKPNTSGLPIFYNSFTFPFWDNKEAWVNNSLLYKNLPFFYNSFLLMEVFDKPTAINQKRLLSIPIFINGRYNIKEKNVTNDFSYERPSFRLKEGMEGYSLFFLNNYPVTDLYVRFSFWDALNGRNIALIPSSPDEGDKKWFQNTKTFKQEMQYLRYALDYTRKTYTIYEYNASVNLFNFSRTNFDLYELAYDNYYDKVRVENIPPVDYQAPTPIPDTFTMPLRFDIGNLISETEVNSKVNDRVHNWLLNYDQSQTFLGSTGSLIDSVAKYAISQNKPVTFELLRPDKFTTFTVPILNSKLVGVNGVISEFNADYQDSSSAKIEKIMIDNLSLTSDNGRFNDSVGYNTKSGDTMVSENFFHFNSEFTTKISVVKDSVADRSGAIPSANSYVLTQELFKSVCLFEDTTLLNALDDELKYRNTVLFRSKLNQADFDAIVNFITATASKLQQQVDLGNSKWKDNIRSAYLKEKYNNTELHKDVIILVVSLLESLYISNKNSPIVNTCVTYVRNKFTVTPTLLQKYKEVNFYVKNNMNWRDGLIFDNLTPEKIISEVKLGYASHATIYPEAFNKTTLLDRAYNTSPDTKFDARDYLFDLVFTYNGNQTVTQGATLNFTLSYNIGKKALYAFSDSTSLTVKGTARITLKGSDGKNKNVMIPLNVKISIV